MGPETRLSAVLVGSLLVWSPALRSAMAGALEPEAAMVRFALVAGAVWIMVGALDRLVGGYARAAEVAAAAAPEVPPRRRRDDEAVVAPEHEDEVEDLPESGPVESPPDR